MFLFVKGDKMDALSENSFPLPFLDYLFVIRTI